jgi:uncharacterized membrane protein YhaH (DUF805 family)
MKTDDTKGALMAVSNPYAAPKAKVSGADTEYGDDRIFSAKGRIGRIRYIGYTIGLTLLFGALLGAVSAFLGRSAGPAAAVPVMFVGYAAMFVVMVLLTIQRAHDFNTTGWLALLSVVPLVNLIFWFIPGTDGENRFGKQTPPNGAVAVLLALVLPLVFILGIVAAIAIPAYQEYTKRALVPQAGQNQ